MEMFLLRPPPPCRCCGSCAKSSRVHTRVLKVREDCRTYFGAPLFTENLRLVPGVCDSDLFGLSIELLVVSRNKLKATFKLGTVTNTRNI
jgi:hypothetical protein